jgi:hypothetical protein
MAPGTVPINADPSETPTSTSGGSQSTTKVTKAHKIVAPPSILTSINNQTAIENYLNSLKNSNESKGTSQTYNKEQIPPTPVPEPTTHQVKDSTRHHKSSQQQPPQSALKNQDAAPNSQPVVSKPQKEPAAVPTVNRRESRKEEKLIALTNLPQLDKIDYIFKTQDEK